MLTALPIRLLISVHNIEAERKLVVIIMERKHSPLGLRKRKFCISGFSGQSLASHVCIPTTRYLKRWLGLLH